MPTLEFDKIVDRIGEHYQTWKTNSAYHPGNLRPRLDPAMRRYLGSDALTEKILNNIGNVIQHNYLINMFEQIFDKPSPDSFQRGAVENFMCSTIGITSFHNLTTLANTCNILHIYLESQPDNLDKAMSEFYEACRDFLNGIATPLH